MSAPAIKIIREMLELNEQACADLLNMDKRSYLLKEQGSRDFEWKEIVTLYNWLTPQIELLPFNKQRDIQIMLGHFPSNLEDEDTDQGVLFDADLPPGITNTTQIKVPVNFVELPTDDTIIDFAGNVNLEIADKIRHTSFFSQYPAFDFRGIVWWHDELGYWAIQVSQLGAYRETLLGTYLDEIVKAIRSRYGTR